MGSHYVERGCGANSNTLRPTIYLMGLGVPDALTIAIDLAKPSRYILRTIPKWADALVHCVTGMRLGR